MEENITFEEAFVLEHLRKEKHLSRRELAELSGVNRGTIEALEMGINNPYQAKMTTLLKLAVALKCKVRDFYPCEKHI